MSRMTSALRWIDSEGGPLILMEESLLKSWGGCFSLSNDSNGVSGLQGDDDYFQRDQSDGIGRKVTDYDRACAVDGYLGLIPVGPGLALVLGDEPMRTTWWPLPESGGILVRWHWANDEGSVVKVLRDLSKAQWQTEDLVFPAYEKPLILFDSALAGSDIDSSLEINLPKGHYNVDTTHFQPNEETSLFLHRLTLKAY